jgi:quinol monooxygenase YgiN
MLELDLQKGRESDFRALMAEMVAATQATEPGTLDYEWSLTTDGTRCHIFKRYADSAAVLAHLGTFGQRFAGRFLEALKPVRFVVYGSPSTAVQDALAGFSPVYMQPAGGFSR